MIKKTLLAILLAGSVSAFGQNNRGYQIKIVDAENVLDEETEANLTASFNAQYPGFASADGYRTKRNVVLEIANTETETIKAKAGEIKVNSNWVKGKSVKKINKELWAALSKNWSSYSKDKHKGYTLTFISKDPNLDPSVRRNLIDTYFEIYPTLVKTFNNKSTHDVLFVVDTAYKAVAEASGNRILFSAGYMKAHPTDIDVVTHETMHIVQGYGYSAGPVWLTEGIADYIRYKYGVDNVGSKWSLPAFNEKQSYKNSYRITARFFAWLEQNIKPGLITSLDEQLRAHQYTEQSWANLTGKTVDQLWDDYAKNPNQVTLTYSDKKSK
ncbi:basic secretory protein-like protein [Pedobacter sandarakinus]|uniref:basic secretory protein-like protein n=1 Tax=Pedobacter sandarakinus TaxID=353156 RepID=UPI00224749F6|nr:basic secretory protein-like protein [Pedobacter sandarakinus]MCX2573065.1 basic secretory protein-like protein [Pedobacter sandarakinus]